MTTWMLLEHTDHLLPSLFRQMGRPDFVRLFDSTELMIYSQFSPLLVKDDSDGTLLQAIKEAPTHWPGLVIESEHSAEAVLEHLRHLLIIRFKQTRKGMLHYWSPAVAECFFPACTDENLNLWLGPIGRLSWHASPETGWRSLDSSYASTWLPTTSLHLLVLSAEQSQALEPHIANGQES
ncbi:DUF4123 domain-containing protein [Pseudomonas sp. RTC3]|uniref:DUF4123 domain-containing protein n=1 Tax=unclassified Pseudomonas TaxID=196821 RepID=UPI002AB535D4|nr:MULTISPECIES: DUF4123 domain-containing protein [unclassified Pseudomonas]MEB0064087.1 DUF4123 domain-containing protein [Pseudomonas sp. RTC3]MDY7568026.1 DUF4123 domain-containing protein [Pseudomonas sp. 5C2]MEB0009870.1 DUF4123 domain-containing protein [Pseudomonas sp. RTB2]MEB0020050.1 DUF4123 domain-containing protein [Pseudomonas sp. RTB3]MEB0242406.1 DUF4123 domain-containing protein [Pseudomonas sp. 5C2]